MVVQEQPDKEATMGEYKGHGTKGRNYDELSGVGTSEAGKTGTTGNLNTAGRDGGVGMPDVTDAGNLQNSDVGQHGDTPALGSGGRGSQNQQNAQSGSNLGKSPAEEQRENEQTAANPNIQGGTRRP
jgi:hypothetical protein